MTGLEVVALVLALWALGLLALTVLLFAWAVQTTRGSDGRAYAHVRLGFVESWASQQEAAA